MNGSGTAVSGGSVGLVSASVSIFTVLLLYYTLARFTGVDYENTTQILSPQAQYILLTVPIVLVGSTFAILGFVNGTVKLPEWFLLAYLVGVVLVSAMRSDLLIVPSTIALVLPVCGIWALGLAPSASLLNGLLYFSIPFGALAYLIGMNFCAIIPGFAHDQIIWRVSIFPGPADTAYFCAPIILANIWYSKGVVLRRLSLALAVYFLLFTVIRSAAIGIGLAVIYIWLAGKPMFQTSFRRWVLITALLIAFIAMVLLPAILSLLLPADLDIPFLNQYLFHSAEGIEGEQGLSETMYRGWLWLQHISLYLQHPLFGMGSYNLNDIIDEHILGPTHDYSGTESLLTGLLSRLGVVAFLLFGALLTKMHQAVKAGEHAAVACGIVAIVMMICHGGIANTYNVEFLMLMGGMNWRTAKFPRLFKQNVAMA